MSQTVAVEVGEDHLATYKRTPRLALAELIWNALDADASLVEINYELNDWGGPVAVTVQDNGVGMTAMEAQSAFRNFGNSWKRAATGTLAGRSLHGKHGRGRYSAFGVGESLEWHTVAKDGNTTSEVVVTGNGSHLQRFEISEPLPITKGTGTRVVIRDLTQAAETELMRDTLNVDLTTRFAVFLQQYPDVRIEFRGNRLDPAALRHRSMTWWLSAPQPSNSAELEVIEWGVKVDRRLYFCAANGSALFETSPGIHAPGYDNFTAYLRWGGFEELGTEILLSEMDQGAVGDLITRAKDKLRDYFKERAEDRGREVIEEWKASKAYPYTGHPTSAAQAAERQAFDLVALSAASVINDGGTAQSRRLALNLLKTALETGPTDLQQVLLNVLELPQETVEELKRLLDRTTLSSVIEASKRISDRINFIAALDALVFDAESKRYTLERTQLHRILANETWIFGEEWSLTGDDERLTEVLKKYLGKLGLDVELADAGPVLREDGRDAIPDLVLSRTLKTSEDRWQHLVVELKRPSHRLNAEDVDQIRSYAVAVSHDERFSNPGEHWTYVLVGNETTTGVDDQREQRHLPYGCVQASPKYDIFVRTWSEVIRDAQHRHKFVQRSLDYTANRDQGVEYLRERHNKYLPDVLRAQGVEAEMGLSPEEPAEPDVAGRDLGAYPS